MCFSAKIAGRNTHRTWMFAPAADTARIRPQPGDELYGVSGWLHLFCISLTFVGPIPEALIAARAFRSLAIARVPSQTLLRLGSMGAIYAGLAVFSGIAGVMLWRKKPKRVSLAKGYLLIGAALRIALFLLLHLAGMCVNLVRMIFTRLVYSVVWYSYLSSLSLTPSLVG